MNKDKDRSQKKHLRIVEKYDNDDYSRYAGPDYSDQSFELGDDDIELRNHSSREYPGVSGKTEKENWINRDQYRKQADFVGYGPRGYKRSDDRIYEDVCENLMKNSEVDATEIGVKVEHGVVHLSGKVVDRRMKKIAELVSEAIPGVKDVRNELNIIPGDDDPRGPDSAARKDLGIR